MASCERFMDLIYQSMDGPLALEDQQALQQHLEECPECRQLSQELSEIQLELHSWQEQEVPEGFAEGVMNCIRAQEQKPKIVPIWKHPQFKMVGSVAACALICLGLWRTGAPQVSEDAVFAPAASAPAAERSDSALYAGDSTPVEAASEFPGAKSAQSPADAAVPSPAALYEATETSPAQDSTSYSLMIHSESASLPSEDQLVQLVQDTLGEVPGTLLLVDVLPALSEGTLHTAADGSQLLVVYAQPEAAVWKTLTEQAYFCLELGAGPVVFMKTP